MPRVFDNIEQALLPALRETLAVSESADFCVGYFNLRGWKQVDELIDRWGGGDNCCRLLVGMQTLPEEELRDMFSLSTDGKAIDPQKVVRLKRQVAEEFRNQLMVGAPTNEDENTLRRLAEQIRAKKVIVKLFLRHPLHAKLYLMYRQDYNNPITGYLGSSNLTLAGLSKQGELNVDVLEYDAAGGSTPVFVGFNAPFDWQFVNWYFHAFLGSNPFGINALDIKAYFMGYAGCAWNETSSSQLPAWLRSSQPKTHNALDDAVAQAAIFAKLLFAHRRNY